MKSKNKKLKSYWVGKTGFNLRTILMQTIFGGGDANVGNSTMKNKWANIYVQEEWKEWEWETKEFINYLLLIGFRLQ